MNAIIGDNGIITRAQEANIQSSIANLEEFLQLKYTENYEQMAQYQSKIEGLTNVFSEYFYIPSQEGVGGLRYVMDNDGHALYLIKKSGLPTEIKENLVGGDAGEGNYVDYQSLSDVYGVTSNLKVYYCSGGMDSIKGLAKENLDNDNPQREVFKADSGMANVLKNYDQNEDGIITAEEAKNVKKLTLNENSGVNSLNDLYNFPNLQELTLNGLNLENMNGVENTSILNYIFISNCVIKDYTAVGKLGKRLQYLYFYDVDDAEIQTLCSTEKGIARYELSNLQYFAIVGNNLCISSVDTFYSSDILKEQIKKTARKVISTIKPLENLSTVTKNAIKFLSLECNDIEDISSLKDFNNLYLVRIEGNKIKTLGEYVDTSGWNGLGNASNLTYLFAAGNELGENEATAVENGKLSGKNSKMDSLACLENKTKLYYLQLSKCNKIKWVEYISGLSTLRYLYLNDCLNFVNVASLRNIIGLCGGNYLIDSKYSLALLDKHTKSLDLSNHTLSIDEFNSLQDCEEIYRLNLENLKLTDLSGKPMSGDVINSTVGNVLINMKNMQYLRLKGVGDLSSVSFIGENGMRNLKELDLRGTKVTDLSCLKDYGKNLVTLILDNGDIQLSDFIYGLTRSCLYVSAWNKGADFWSDGNGCGLMLCSEAIWKQLEKCTNLKYFSICNKFYEPASVNLSNLEELKEFGIVACQNSSFSLPSNLNYLRLSAGSFGKSQLKSFDENLQLTIRDRIDEGNLSSFSGALSRLSGLKNLSFEDAVVVGINDFSEMNFPNSLTYLKISHFSKRDTMSLNGLQNLVNLEELYIFNYPLSNIDALSSLTKLDTLTIKSGEIVSLPDLSGLSNLQYVYLDENNINNISGLKNNILLDTLSLSNNEISKLDAIKDMKKLKYLDLKNNCLDDMNFKVGEEIYNNLTILAGLNKTNGGLLEKLYLAGNTGIINLSTLRSLNWVDKDF